MRRLELSDDEANCCIPSDTDEVKSIMDVTSTRLGANDDFPTREAVGAKASACRAAKESTARHSEAIESEVMVKERDGL